MIKVKAALLTSVVIFSAVGLPCQGSELVFSNETIKKYGPEKTTITRDYDTQSIYSSYPKEFSKVPNSGWELKQSSITMIFGKDVKSLLESKNLTLTGSILVDYSYDGGVNTGDVRDIGIKGQPIMIPVEIAKTTKVTFYCKEKK